MVTSGIIQEELQVAEGGELVSEGGQRVGRQEGRVEGKEGGELVSEGGGWYGGREGGRW